MKLSDKTKRSAADIACWLAIFLCGAFLSLALAHQALAQEARHPPHEHPYSHETMLAQNEGVDVYAGWRNRNNGDCCHGVHCKPIEASRVRENGHGTEIQVEGQWCPVEPWMFLKVGRSPDWSKHHACINDTPDEGGNSKPYQRLICFAGLPGG